MVHPNVKQNLQFSLKYSKTYKLTLRLIGFEKFIDLAFLIGSPKFGPYKSIQFHTDSYHIFIQVVWYHRHQINGQ